MKILRAFLAAVVLTLAACNPTTDEQEIFDTTEYADPTNGTENDSVPGEDN